MNNTITKSDIVRNISRDMGVNYTRAREIFNVIINIISHNLREGNPIKIRNFGKFSIRKRPQRQYYNPITKKKELSKKKTVIHFRVSSALLKKEIVEDSSYLSFPKLKELGIISSVLNKNITLKNQLILPKENSIRQKKQFNNYIRLQELSGNILLPNELNTGFRRKKTNTASECADLETVGVVSNDIDFLSVTESEEYHFVAYPVNGTPILNYKTFEGIVEGVTEPLLYYSLQEIKDIEYQIKILQNTTLPIRNRNYGYKPDIAIVWEEKNFYLDIEIDEPYDILSRKPIHFKSCSDDLRNEYFIDNGWYVLRFCEQQIVEHLSEVTNTIIKFISEMLNDARFYRQVNLSYIQRWSYDEALEMERNKAREKLLKIEIPQHDAHTAPTDSEYTTIQSFNYIKPAEDIIEDRYETMREKIEHLASTYLYLILCDINESYEYVTEKKYISFVNEQDHFGIKIYDVIENKEYILKYKQIIDIKGTNNIFKTISDDYYEKSIYEAVINRNPIYIVYQTSEGFESIRNVITITPWFNIYEENSKDVLPKQLLDLGTKYIYPNVSKEKSLTHFSGYCCYRHDLRTFKTSRIIKLKVYNCMKSGHIFRVNDLWEYLTNDFGEAAELLYYTLPSKKQNELIYIGNLCNALIMQDRIEEAVKRYMSHNVNELVYYGKNWHDACWEDIEYFEKESKFKENFTEVKTILKSKGW